MTILQSLYEPVKLGKIGGTRLNLHHNHNTHFAKRNEYS